MPRKETKISSTALILFNLAVVVIFFVLYSFTMSQVTDTVAKESQIKAEVIKKDKTYIMKNDIKLGKSYENSLYSYIVGKDGIADLIRVVEGLASKSSLKSEIKNISYETQNNLSSVGLEFIKIEMKVSGEWKNLNYFIELLENYPLKIQINSSSLAMIGTSANKKPEWSGDFELMIVKFR